VTTPFPLLVTDLCVWASQVASVGLSIDLSRSQQIRTAGRRWTMLVSQVAPTPTQVSLGDVLALLADAEVQHTGRPPPLTGYVAEALFSSLTTISFISGFQASRNGVVLRRQLHCAGVFLVSYDYTNGSERELRLWPHRVRDHLRSQLEEEAIDLRSQGWDVIRFIPTGDPPSTQQRDLKP